MNRYIDRIAAAGDIRRKRIAKRYIRPPSRENPASTNGALRFEGKGIRHADRALLESKGNEILHGAHSWEVLRGFSGDLQFIGNGRKNQPWDGPAPRSRAKNLDSSGRCGILADKAGSKDQNFEMIQIKYSSNLKEN